MSVSRKFQTAWEGQLICHGALAGNTLPLKWVDNSGSIRRRLVVFHFAYAVEKSSTDLMDKLKTEELSAIMRKINFCYRRAIVLLSGKDDDLWGSGIMSKHIKNRMKPCTWR